MKKIRIYTIKNGKKKRIKVNKIKGKIPIIEDWGDFDIYYGVVSWAEYIVKSKNIERVIKEFKDIIIEAKESGYSRFQTKVLIAGIFVNLGLDYKYLIILNKTLDEVYND